MTDNEIRIAVAEASGKFCKTYKPKAHSLYCDNCGQLPNTQSHYPTTFPDYPRDLNAIMLEITKLIKKKRLRVFCNAGSDGMWECVITENETPNAIPCDGDHYGAGDTLSNAMCEAYLRTVGKWKDEPTSSPQIQKQKP